MRRRADLSWALFGLSASMLLVALALRVLTRDAALPMGDWGFRGTSMVPSAAIAVVGWTLNRHRPGNSLGWVFAVVGTLSSLSALALEYAVLTLIARPGSLFGGEIAAWLNEWLWVATVGGMGLYTFGLFPDGTVTDRASRSVLAIGTVLMAGLTITESLAPGELTIGGVRNPVIEGSDRLMEAVENPLVYTFLGAALAQALLLGRRFARSEGIERQQMKWFAFAAVFVPIFIMAGGVLDSIGPGSGAAKLAQSLSLLAMAGLPVAVGVAILRYRLYDIDRVISRTVTYAIVTGVLVAGYVGLVVLMQRVTEPLTGGSDLAVAASTLAATAAFVPLRRRVQDVVDRRFNRARYDAARTIEAFAARLREEIVIDELTADLRTLVGRTMEPARVSLWLSEQTP